MNPTLFVSRQLVADFREKLTGILTRAPRKLDILEFTPDINLTPEQQASIEVTFYSRDIWEGTIKTRLSDAAKVYWPIVDTACNLKWLQVVSAGSDQKPYQPSIKRGLRVTTSAGANAEPVGLTGVTGLMMLARGFPHYMRAQQKREWSPQLGAASPPDMPGQTVVIVGMGHIGKVIARVLHAVGMRVIGLRRNVAPAENFDEVLPLSALEGLLPTCDWLVLACPLSAETRGLMDERRFRLMPRMAGVVNMARGEVIDEAALTRVLASGHLRGAYLDVFSVEPLSPESPLWAMPNVIITPHNSSTGTGNYRRGVEIFLRNLEAYFRGDATLENEVER
ncbi:MAG: D-2-hydroxyacid dehydrogenase [Burkholderiales bacterium]